MLKSLVVVTTWIRLRKQCTKVKPEVLQCIINNINDQNGNDESLAALMSMFDLSTSEDFESHNTKLSALYDIYGVDTIHSMERWLVFY